ncbi:MAG: metallophosphoesterase, partial [Candidatus Neomarinimicrobiota bacterium]
PLLERMYLEYQEQFRRWATPGLCYHIWTAGMPTGLAPGGHKIVVRTRDQYGKAYEGARVFEIEGIR